MTILPFRQFRKAEPQHRTGGWDQSEVADFYRAHRLLTDQGICFGIDQGVSDDGDPWFVFFDFDTHDVFLHLARFDGRCLLVCEQLGLNLTATSVSEVVRRFEAEVRELVNVRRSSGNVIAHPATKIITSISVIFLLFKMDNTGANAGTAETNAESGLPGASRLADLQAQIMQRGTFARLFDGADSPMGAALIAGLVMSTAIAEATLNDAERADEKDSETNILVEADAELIEAEQAEQVAAAVAAEARQTVESGQQEAQISAEAAPATDIAAVDIAVPENAAPEKEAAESEKNEPEQEFAFLEETSSGKKEAPAPKEAVEEETVSSQPVAETAKPLEEEEAETGLEVELDTDTEETDHLAGDNSGGGEEIEIASSFGLKSVLEEKFDLSLKELDALFSDALFETAPAAETEDVSLIEATDDAPRVHNITLDVLDDLSADAGKTIVTKLGITDIKEIFRVVLEKFEGYELQYKDGDLLIEQAHLDGTKAEDITIWTNVMADGSEISFVGMADLSEAAAPYLAA